MSVPNVHPVIDEGLGNSAYAVDLGDGRALVVDAPRDLRAVRAVTDRLGLRIAFAADTHLHADFLSGARQLSATDGSVVLASAAGGREFTHTGLADGDEVDLGGLRLQAWETPGHTGEHLAFLLLDGGQPLGVFTGGSLMVSSAARTDLSGPDQTGPLARAQYASIQRLLRLPDPAEVWPTHGAGSFCSAPPVSERTSTIGRERATNPLLAAPGDENAFVERLLGGLGSYPPYFRDLGEANRRGPGVVTGRPELRSLDVAAVRAAVTGGARLLDVRTVNDYAAAHIPGSLSVPLRPVFATWLGWLTGREQSLVMVRAGDQDPEEILWQALKIGYENIIGELDGGIATWAAAGEQVTSTPLIQADDEAGLARAAGTAVLDIRQSPEFAAGHVPGAMHVELGDVAARVQELPVGPMVVMCGHGERAMSAASLLEAAGRRDLSVLAGGPQDWSAATSRPLVLGAADAGTQG